MQARLCLKVTEEDAPDISHLDTKFEEFMGDEGVTGRILYSKVYTNEDIARYGWKRVREWIDADIALRECYGTKWKEVYISVEATFFMNYIKFVVSSLPMRGIKYHRGWPDAVFLKENAEFVKLVTQELQILLKPLEVTVDVKDISVVTEVKWRD